MLSTLNDKEIRGSMEGFLNSEELREAGLESRILKRGKGTVVLCSSSEEISSRCRCVFRRLRWRKFDNEWFSRRHVIS